MVTYQVQIPESNQAAFMDIIKSLQSLGIISSFSISESLAHPGEPVAMDNLLQMLQSAEKQAEDGTVVPANHVIEFMKSWRERK